MRNNAPEQTEHRVALWMKREHIVHKIVGHIVSGEIIIDNDIEEVGGGVNRKRATDTGENLLRLNLYMTEGDHKEGQARAEGMREKIKKEYIAENGVFRLNGVKEKCERCTDAEEREKVAEEFISCENKKGRQEGVIRTDVQGKVLQRRGRNAPYDDIINQSDGSDEGEEEEYKGLGATAFISQGKVQNKGNQDSDRERDEVGRGKTSPFQFRENLFIKGFDKLHKNLISFLFDALLYHIVEKSQRFFQIIHISL